MTSAVLLGSSICCSALLLLKKEKDKDLRSFSHTASSLLKSCSIPLRDEVETVLVLVGLSLLHFFFYFFFKLVTHG